MKPIGILRRALDTVISPMIYIMAFVSIVIGFSYAFLEDLPDIQNSLLFKHGILLGDFNVWGVLLMIGATFTIIGLRTQRRFLLEPGAMLGFMMWLFACITYASGGFFFAFLTYSFFHLLFYGYVYLASSTGVIRRIALAHLAADDE